MMMEEIKNAFIENKVAIIVAAAIFLITIFLGFYLEHYLYDFFNPVVDDLSQKVQTGVITLTFKSLFLNNIRVVFMMFLFGLLFCISAVILAYNGFFTGYYIATTDDLLQTFLLIMPHGIFEFSSCIVACASGFVLFNSLHRFLKTLLKQKNTSIKERLSASCDASFRKLKQAIILLAVASVLMAIAGVVEAYLTLPIADFVYSILH